MLRVVPILLLIIFFTGCDKPRHVSPAEFKREYELRNQQTMIWAEYFGEKDGKAYLKRKNMSTVKETWREEVLFTEVNALDATFLEGLRQSSITNEQKLPTNRVIEPDL